MKPRIRQSGTPNWGCCRKTAAALCLVIGLHCAAQAQVPATNQLPYLTTAVKTVRLSVFAVAGSTNQLESSTNGQNWTPYGSPFVVTNSPTFQDVDVSGSQQFFRVVPGTLVLNLRYTITAHNLDDTATNHSAGVLVASYNVIGTVTAKTASTTRHIYTKPFPFPTFLGQVTDAYIEGHLFTMYYQGGPGNPGLPYYEITGDDAPIAVGDSISLSLSVPADFGTVVAPGFTVTNRVTIPVSKAYTGTVGQYLLIAGAHYQVLSFATTNALAPIN
jgi:hypothetical protein